MTIHIVFIVATLLFTPCHIFQIAAGFVVAPYIAPPIRGLRLSDLSDTFDQMRGGHRHGAIDIMRPEGTPVVSDGIIRKLFLSKAGATRFTNSTTPACIVTTTRTLRIMRRDFARIVRIEG